MRRITAEVTNVDSFELVPQFKLNDPLIYQIGIALKVNLESQGVCDRLYTESMAMAISTHLLQFYSTRNSQLKSYSQGLSRAKLKKATEYINENLTQNISLATMALMVQMSPFYFSRLFKQSTGLTPHQYLIKCRIEEAKQLLRISNLSMAAIAIEIGFADQSHFTRHFKRYVGITPSQFRAN